MISGLYEDDVIAISLFGIIVNFLFSFLFGWYLTQNIGIEEMVTSKGDRKQSWFVGVSMLIPFAKMLVTLYRVLILQIYFLNHGRSYKEFWVYMTHEEGESR
jgi:hypothetical protein